MDKINIENKANKGYIELSGITCAKCNDYFLTKFESGKHKCPSCGHENEIFCLKEDSPFMEKMEEIIDKIINPGKVKCPLCKRKLDIKKIDDEGCLFTCKCGYYFGFDNKGEEENK